MTVTESLALARLTGTTLPQRVERERKARENAARLSEVDPKPIAPEKRRSLTRGLSPTKTRERLNCTETGLNRWSDDGRLPPDGERYYHGVGPLGGGKWGRCWLPETIEAAAPMVTAWRTADETKKRFKRTGLGIVGASGNIKRLKIVTTTDASKPL